MYTNKVLNILFLTFLVDNIPCTENITSLILLNKFVRINYAMQRFVANIFAHLDGFDYSFLRYRYVGSPSEAGAPGCCHQADIPV